MDSEATVSHQFQVGDRVFWDNCPAHAEWANPFEVMEIRKEYAKPDIYEIRVLISELRKA